MEQLQKGKIEGWNREVTYIICTALRNWRRLDTTKNYNAIKAEFWTKRIDLKRLRDKQ